MMSNIINNSSLQSNESFDFIFKIVLIGDCSTGKSCIVERFRNGTYNEPQPATVGVDFSIKTVCMHGKTIKVSIFLNKIFLIFSLYFIVLCNIDFEYL